MKKLYALSITPLTSCITLILLGQNSFASPTDVPTQSPVIATKAGMWRPGTSPIYQVLEELRQMRRPTSALPSLKALKTVTTCADDGSAGSLRAVVDSAASGDVIDLSALQCSRITLANGAVPIVVDDLTLQGAGASKLTIDGNTTDRVLVHVGKGTLTLNGLTLTKGFIKAPGFKIGAGGCVASVTNVALINSTVRDCKAEGIAAYGGGVLAFNQLTMSGSSIIGNTALGVHPQAGTAAFGGGVWVHSLDMVNSTVSGNIATLQPNPGFDSYETGGGIFSEQGGNVENSTVDNNYSHGNGGGFAAFSTQLTITNSTISGNIAETSEGGGVRVRPSTTLRLNNSTLTQNQAKKGGGGVFFVYSSTNSVFQSSIIANNSAVSGNPDIFTDSPSVIVLTGANNLIKTTTPLVVLPGDTIMFDPQLLPLANNGGLTRTHALAKTSPAIDVGNNLLNMANDQRGNGYPRIVATRADIGAFEMQPAPVIPQQLPSLSIWMAAVLAGLLGWLARKRMIL